MNILGAIAIGLLVFALLVIGAVVGVSLIVGASLNDIAKTKKYHVRGFHE